MRAVPTRAVAAVHAGVRTASCLWAVAALISFGVLAAHADELTEQDVSARVREIIAERSSDGVYSFYDVGSGATHALVLEEIRAVRGLPDFGWFPDVVFHDKDAPAKKYTVDFWLKPDGDVLKLIDAQVHKGPVADGDGWMMITRRPLLWWWLPTLKRASAVRGMQAWQVMGHIHAHIAAKEKDGAFPLSVADGNVVPTHMEAIHQPVGRAHEDGRYFACVALRKKGDAAAAYAVDFWLDPDAGSVSVGNARLYENPRVEDGKAAARPPCHFEGIAFDVVD